MRLSPFDKKLQFLIISKLKANSLLWEIRCSVYNRNELVQAYELGEIMAPDWIERHEIHGGDVLEVHCISADAKLSGIYFDRKYQITYSSTKSPLAIVTCSWAHKIRMMIFYSLNFSCESIPKLLQDTHKLIQCYFLRDAKNPSKRTLLWTMALGNPGANSMWLSLQNLKVRRVRNLAAIGRNQQASGLRSMILQSELEYSFPILLRAFRKFAGKNRM